MPLRWKRIRMGSFRATTRPPSMAIRARVTSADATLSESRLLHGLRARAAQLRLPGRRRRHPRRTRPDEFGERVRRAPRGWAGGHARQQDTDRLRRLRRPVKANIPGNQLPQPPPFYRWTGPRQQMFAPSELISGKFRHSDEFLKLALNPGGGSGGLCFGDSGGPDLLGGTSPVLGVNSYVTNVNCAGVGYSPADRHSRSPRLDQRVPLLNQDPQVRGEGTPPAHPTPRPSSP